ncbi:MAG: GTP-binding protein LepA [Microgenomates group bacterium Gr01-1014_16]|nr:MAG: GTP-binding protein LepA [Microgenomates group bacterium Gr01-1014_16]
MLNIRNFAIIAHVDHGKSTLADRMLEITGTVSKRQMQDQILDSNPIERERGITIKLAPVRMLYKSYILNLIDTPGHVDFSYEVNRSLAACEGAILLVDATQGIQAQTLAHYHQAKKLSLTVIPVINKIDINTADVAGTKKQISEILGFDSPLLISAKTGEGVPELLEAVINQVPAPVSQSQTVRALVFNSNFDVHLGVIAWVRVVDGQIKTGDKLFLLGTKSPTTVLEVGVFSPAKTPTDKLSAGEVGYVVTNLRDISQIQVGDTLSDNLSTSPLPGYQPIKPVVFVSFYPTDGGEINNFRTALSKLRLQDSSFTYTPEFSPALGNGFRLGLLGLLHADIVQERLEREFGLNLIAAAASVSYQILTMNHELITINQPAGLPDPSQIKEIREPIIHASLFLPQSYLGAVMQLCQDHRGTLIDMSYLGNLVELRYSLPLSELIRGFHDHLKSVSQGFATLDYELSGYQASDLVKLDILIASDRVDALSQIVPRSQSPYLARDLVERLKEIIPRAQFEITIQAAIGGHILARADVKAFRKDVTAKLYGGDQTRKDKLLKKQKKGKSRMKQFGRVSIPQEAFLSILKV